MFSNFWNLNWFLVMEQLVIARDSLPKILYPWSEVLRLSMWCYVCNVLTNRLQPNAYSVSTNRIFPPHVYALLANTFERNATLKHAIPGISTRYYLHHQSTSTVRTQAFYQQPPTPTSSKDHGRENDGIYPVSHQGAFASEILDIFQ